MGRKQSRAGQLGRVGIGLGLILLALELIVQAVTPITQANGVQVIFASLTGDIMLDALIGAMFAIISYSSLAAVLLTATLTAAGLYRSRWRCAWSSAPIWDRGCWRCSIAPPMLPRVA